MGPYTLEPAPGHSCFASIDQRHPPGLHAVGKNFHFVVSQFESYIASMQEVIRKVLLDEMAHVATANDEVIDPMEGIQLHDVPENRFPTDLDHWFWFDLGFFTQSGAETPG